MPKNYFEASPPQENKPIPHIPLPQTEGEKSPASPLVTNHPTGEAYSAHFEGVAANDALAANDEIFDRRKRATPKEVIQKDPDLNQRISEYTKLALRDDFGLEKAIEKWKHDKAEAFLIDTGILERDLSGSFILTAAGKEKLLQKGWTNWGNNGKRGFSPVWVLGKEITTKYTLPYSKDPITVTALDYVSYLENCQALDAEHLDQPALPVAKIPRSLEEVIHGEFSGTHLKPWEMLVGITSFTDPLPLADGSISSLAELSAADVLRKLNAHRDDKGVLLVEDPKTHQEVRFRAQIFRQYFPNFSAGEGAFFSQPADNTQKLFPNLNKKGLLTTNDFIVYKGFNENSVVAPSDRKLSSSATISLSDPEGGAAMYYIGRAKIIGTDIPLDRSTDVLRYLDSRTCAIVRIKGGQEEILTTFPLIAADELAMRREETRQRLSASGLPNKEGNVTGKTLINAPDMLPRMHPYRTSDFVPKLPDETPKEYADRIAKLNDVRLVSKTTREFFQRFNIGLHQLPWAEQLAASSILFDPRFSKEEIGTFCERYGIDGLRTFISSTYGKNINRDLLALGKKAPELAERTFKKYSEVLAVVDEAESSLRSFGIAEKLDADKREQSIRDIKGQLTQKAKGVLEKITTSVQQIKTLSKNTLATLEAELSSSQGDALLYLNTFKVLKENGVLKSLSEAEKFQLEMFRGGEITPALQKQMLDLYDKNYPLGKKHSKAFREKLFAGLKEAFENPSTTFHTVTRDGQLDAYLRFDEEEQTPDGQKQIYFGSFNVGPKGARVGETFLDECLKQESPDTIINASADPTLPISSHYIERNDFVGTGIEKLADKPLIKIKRDSRLNERLITKKATSLANDPAIRERVKHGEIIHTKCSSGDMPDFSPLEKGFVLTRFLISKDGTITCIFEKPLPSKESA